VAIDIVNIPVRESNALIFVRLAAVFPYGKKNKDMAQSSWIWLLLTITSMCQYSGSNGWSRAGVFTGS
jgi:hypothetical protein